MVVCYFWYVTVTNLCHSNKFSLSNQQITFYSVAIELAVFKLFNLVVHIHVQV